MHTTLHVYVPGLSARQQQVTGNLQRVRALVRHHVAQANEARNGQFLSAASKGEIDRIKLMLQQGFAVDSADYDNRTGLMLASAHGHMVRDLVSGHSVFYEQESKYELSR